MRKKREQERWDDTTNDIVNLTLWQRIRVLGWGLRFAWR